MIKKLVIVGLLCASIGIGYWWYYSSANFVQNSSIMQLDNGFEMKTLSTEAEKDFIRKQFKDNWQHLIESPDYDIEYFMNKRGIYPHQPEYEGKMQIKILYKDDKMVGFTGYYMKSPTAGTILFINVDKENRGKRYGEVLTRYAIAGLKELGAKFVHFSTKVSNLSAQKLYDRVGCERLHDTDKYHVHYRASFK